MVVVALVVVVVVVVIVSVLVLIAPTPPNKNPPPIIINSPPPPLPPTQMNKYLAYFGSVKTERHNAFANFYFSILKYNGAHVAKALKICAEPSNQPVVIHCTSGKDRTGLIVAMLLAAVGVPKVRYRCHLALGAGIEGAASSLTLVNTAYFAQKEEIIQDYRRSHDFGFSVKHMQTLGILKERVARGKGAPLWMKRDPEFGMLLGATRESMEGMLDLVEEEFGSYDDYLDSIGFDETWREMLRASFVEPVNRGRGIDFAHADDDGGERKGDGGFEKREQEEGEQEEEEEEEAEQAYGDLDILYEQNKFVELHAGLEKEIAAQGGLASASVALLWRFCRVAGELEDVKADGSEELIFEALDATAVMLSREAVDREAAFHGNKWAGILLGQAGNYKSTADQVRDTPKIKEHIIRALSYDASDSACHHTLGRWHCGFVGVGGKGAIDRSIDRSRERLTKYAQNVDAISDLPSSVRTGLSWIFSIPSASYEEAHESFAAARRSLGAKPWHSNTLWMAKSAIKCGAGDTAATRALLDEIVAAAGEGAAVGEVTLEEAKTLLNEM